MTIKIELRVTAGLITFGEAVRYGCLLLCPQIAYTWMINRDFHEKITHKSRLIADCFGKDLSR